MRSAKDIRSDSVVAPRCYWTSFVTGSLTADTDTDVAFDWMDYLAREPGCPWWRIRAITSIRNGTTGAGVVEIVKVVCFDEDIGLNAVIGGQPFGTPPLDVLLPRVPGWDGTGVITLNNRTGTAAVFRISIGLEPLVLC